MTRLHIRNRLFAEPSFLDGVARAIDIGGTLQQYNESATEHEADMRALKNDWRAVGDDLRVAIDNEREATGTNRE